MMENLNKKKVTSKDTSVLFMLEPLKQFFDDPDVTEICINSPCEVYTEYPYRIHRILRRPLLRHKS